MTKKMPKLLILLLLVFNSSTWASCTITMVFKLGDKSPLMKAAPDNSGIFNDLYSLAAKRIGCSLSITRLPKARLHQGLKMGIYDFYPAASFSKERTKYLTYINNGLTTKEYGMSSLGIKNITDFQQLTYYDNVIWLTELNSSKSGMADKMGIPYQQINYLNVDILLNFIQARPQFNYFYIADKTVVDNFLMKNAKNSLSDHGIRLHEQCCGETQPMYLAFSRYSPHMKETANPHYQAGKTLSATNQMLLPAKNSIAQQFAAALQALQKEGITNSIYQHWHPVASLE